MSVWVITILTWGNCKQSSVCQRLSNCLEVTTNGRLVLCLIADCVNDCKGDQVVESATC